ncbi:HAMP domain-containing histidine kinase [bacterium]|nr:HAMP domain-containing histidine kinase [bacterium]
MPRLSTRAAFVLFIILVVVAVAQAVWWIVFMAMLVDEKVDIARDLGAPADVVEAIHRQEVQRQIMVGLEGCFFLVLLLVGAWLIYRALVKAEQLKFHQENFIMAVTHELKTPLASMLVSLDSIASPRIPDEKKQALVPRMKDDVRRLERIVNNVLEAGRIGRERAAAEMQPVDLSALVEKVVARMESFSTRLPLTVDKKITPGVQVMANPQSLSQALEAVLENSLKYHDGSSIHISVGLRTDSDRAVIEVSDRGIGLNREDCEAVFDRFYRVGNELTRRTEGTGLGLYLAREIVRGHRGSITAHSDGIGKGTTFVISLKAGASI